MDITYPQNPKDSRRNIEVFELDLGKNYFDAEFMSLWPKKKLPRKKCVNVRFFRVLYCCYNVSFFHYIYSVWCLPYFSEVQFFSQK